MKKYIEYEEAINELTEENLVLNLDSVMDGLTNQIKRSAHRILASLPAADVVTVLCCKDCRYCHYDRVGNIGCFHYRNFQTPGAEIKPYDYCSYAEKRTGYEEDRRYYERHNSSQKMGKDGDGE